MATPRGNLEEDAQCQVPPIPFPMNESERLRILRESSILDTLPDEAYDCITRLCSRAFKVGRFIYFPKILIEVRCTIFRRPSVLFLLSM